MRALKRLLNAAADADTASILLAESKEQAALIGSPNQIEAVRAGVEKRRRASPIRTEGCASGARKRKTSVGGGRRRVLFGCGGPIPALFVSSKMWQTRR